MNLKGVAEICVVGILVSQLGFVCKPCSSLVSSIDKQIFLETLNYDLHNKFLSRKSYRLNITGNESCNLEDVEIVNEDCNLDCEMKNENQIEDAINISATKYGVDEKLIKSLIKQESNFNPNCVSSAGAIGLMQIMPNTIKKFNVEDPYDIYQNIDAGTKHLKGMIERYEGDIVKAVAAYNCGGNSLDKSGFESLEDVSMLPKETRIHVTKVFHYYENGF